jgi:hypothetical protein
MDLWLAAYALIANPWPAGDAAIICAWRWIIRSMTLCCHAEAFDPLLLAAGVVMLTCDPSAYVMVVVLEPSVLVTVWLLSPANGSLDEPAELVENGSFGSLPPPVGELAPPRPPAPWW